MPKIDVIREVDDLRETLDTTTGIRYIPCIINILLYNNMFCDNRCYCRNACFRLKLGILK